MKSNFPVADKASFPNPKALAEGIQIQENKVSWCDLWFQPMGICYKEGLGVCIGDYFGPSIWIGDYFYENNRLMMPLKNFASARNGISNERIFPNFFDARKANRIQTVNPLGGDRLLVSRNGDNTFFELAIVDKEKQILELVGQHETGRNSMIHSALTIRSCILTIESLFSKKKGFYNWKRNDSKINQSGLKRYQFFKIESWRYGFAARRKELISLPPWTITDYRAERETYGIYEADNKIFPDIYGNGLIFLSDGSILGIRYGYTSYETGKLFHIPASLLK